MAHAGPALQPQWPLGQSMPMAGGTRMEELRRMDIAGAEDRMLLQERIQAIQATQGFGLAQQAHGGSRNAGGDMGANSRQCLHPRKGAGAGPPQGGLGAAPSAKGPCTHSTVNLHIYIYTHISHIHKDPYRRK